MEGWINAMDENIKEKIGEKKFKELLDLAKRKKNVLEYNEINDFFHEFELDPEDIDKILEILESNNVDILRITDDDDDAVDDEIILDEKD